MNRQPILFVGLVLAGLGFAIGYSAGSGGGLSGPFQPQAGPRATEDSISCYFSPKGGCTDAVVEQIERAQQTIHVQAYSFTSQPIIRALVAAWRRGVKVIVVMDKSDVKDTSRRAADDFLRAKIPTYIDAEHSIAHNKIILIDGQAMITGSFNFTTQAENSNAENLLVIHDHPKLYTAYEQNFQHHLGHSEPFSGAESEPKTTRRKTSGP
jgi:phosphatidylserine/phosphatidylglycerophosphate/cardiolipin synthase-like enzyme